MMIASSGRCFEMEVENVDPLPTRIAAIAAHTDCYLKQVSAKVLIS